MSGEDKILLEIVTPKGRALSETVDEVTVPAQGGEFGVLPGHLPTLANLRTGIVSYRKGADLQKCAVGSGFVEAGPAKVLILTEDYTTRPLIEPQVVVVRTELASVQAEIQKAEQEATEVEPTASARLQGLIAKENWLAAQLELYGDAPPPTMRPYEEYGPPAPVAAEELTESPSADR